MKARVLVRFRDKHTFEIHEKGTTIDVTEERFEEILKVGKYVEAVRRPKKAKAEE